MSSEPAQAVKPQLEQEKAPADKTLFLELFKAMRAEAARYHEAIWKVVFAGIAASGAAAVFLLGPEKFDPLHTLKLPARVQLLSAIVILIGISMWTIVKAYVRSYLRSSTFSHAYRNAILHDYSREKTSTNLDKKQAEADGYAGDFNVTLKWMIGPYLLVAAGLSLLFVSFHL